MLEWRLAQVAHDLTLRLSASPAGVCAIEFDGLELPPANGRENGGNPLLAETARQLRAYFAGELREFDLPLDLRGTEFQLRAWREVCAIPYGETRSYAEIAGRLGSPGAVRAVGAANGANPVPIVVPCHRVIGASGKLVGYGGGLELKRRLLDLERGNGRLTLGL
jgi:methylated-DNA-[protein]-cysteine S-methyltransferase